VLADVQDICDIESGEFKMTFSPFSLEELIKHSLALYAPLAQAAKVSLSYRVCDADKELPESV
jgi:signal transduction histidine kinase